ncbi:hypothetical protein [Methylobacterium isbiliense]|uniref:Uncharacterized protein n=1 Tax=Methylobacterium isbiliense TaxID=315478 RepID=A0ABQ4SC76_9HYPH|nr:hypothetical protein [Methylobacterium isbiliense]MDN3627429.1 hypothetical protein [Methylobacterium isbiliense]GJE00644.1 hypothetical protein GMJLKIPL_2568 [Methylobacterium isbiliense]
MHRHRFTAHLRLWYAAAKGYRIYALAFLLALPDMLDALAGADLAPILPEGWGTVVGGWLAVLRIVLGIYLRRLPSPAPGGRA